jgi:hypothetical protein
MTLLLHDCLKQRHLQGAAAGSHGAAQIAAGGRSACAQQLGVLLPARGYGWTLLRGVDLSGTGAS